MDSSLVRKGWSLTEAKAQRSCQVKFPLTCVDLKCAVLEMTPALLVLLSNSALCCVNTKEPLGTSRPAACGNAEDGDSGGAGAVQQVEGGLQAESGHVILLFPVVSVRSKVYPCLINSVTGKAWRPSALGLCSLLLRTSSEVL